MKFVMLKTDNGSQPAVFDSASGKIIALKDMGFGYENLTQLIENYSPDLKAKISSKMAEHEGVPYSTNILDAPIPHPAHDIICVGMNYVKHAKEAAAARGREYEKPKAPIFFSKRVDRGVAPEGNIPNHSRATQCLDYECELAVIIGKKAFNLEPSQVDEHIFGYTIVNDVTARDLQVRHVQYTFGKGLDGFAPMGPFIATADEFNTPISLNIKTSVNGEPRQNGNTADFIFDIPRLISELTKGITLFPGDIIITGTPAGVGIGFDPPKYLKSGDVIQCEIAGLGILRNTVK